MKYSTLVASLFAVILAGTLAWVVYVNDLYTNDSNGQWAFSTGSVWVSATEISDLNPNNWFYMAKVGKVIVAVEVDFGNGSYITHYNLGDGNGWQSTDEPKSNDLFPVGQT